MVGKRWHPGMPSSSPLATSQLCGEFEDAKAEWAVEQEAAKAAQRERKSQKALKKREARHRKKEKDAHAAAERSAEIQARWGVADKVGKENNDVWPTCEK